VVKIYRVALLIPQSVSIYSPFDPEGIIDLLQRTIKPLIHTVKRKKPMYIRQSALTADSGMNV